jgi:hypothetical protein
MIGGEVIKVGKRITEMTDSAELFAAERVVSCEMNVTQSAPRNGASAGAPPQIPMKQLLEPPKPGDSLDIHLGLIRINQLAITGVSGEVGSGIFQHLKRASPLKNTIMITLSNDRDGYIPDDAGWDHQGNGQAFVRGCAERAIVDNLVEMMSTTPGP